MRPPTSSLRRITLLSCAMSAGILMREKARSARDVARARGTRSRNLGRSVRRKGTRIWGCSIGTVRCESRRGGRLGMCCWWARGRARCSRHSTYSCSDGCSVNACFGRPSVQTATLTPRFTSHSVSHLCPCQGRMPVVLALDSSTFFVSCFKSLVP